MKRNKLALAGLALLGTGSLALAGCSGGGGDEGNNGGGDGNGGGIITVNGSEPQNPLVPTNTNEVGGGKILDAIFAGLIGYDADGKVFNDVAEEITTDSPTELTIKIREGLEFTNGEEITADNFINAWNYGAEQENAQKSQYFFEDIEGFVDDPGDPNTDEDDLYGAQGDGLSGLQQVDDYTFTVTLNKPASDFAQRLGYSAYYPLPDVAFEDMAAFGENPIGNGPYMLDGEGAWQHDVQADLAVNPDYDGPRTPQNDGLRIVFYATQDAAYNDLLAGNLDVLDAIPDAAFETYQDELGDRWVNDPAAIFQSFTMGYWDDRFTGEAGQLRRQAISMAIDREQITDVIFQGTRTPATDFTSPVIDGYQESLEGDEVIQYNEEEAKKLWDDAEAISPWEGTFELAYNADGGHQAWVDAVANSISNTLGIDAVGKPYPDFAGFRDAVAPNEGEAQDAIFRTGWQADYPGLYNFLGPLYATNASSNDGDYSNPEFDQLLSEGISETDPEAANEKFIQAQEVLLQDLPVIPLWYSNITGGWSENVENVQFDWHSVPIFHEITKVN